MSDKEKLKSIGIVEGVKFELQELNGEFIVDTKHKVVCDVANCRNDVVRGLYGNLLKGKYHVKRYRNELAQ